MLSIDASGGVAVLATAGVAAALAGAALRRYRLLAVGAALLLPAYWGAVLVAGHGPDFWAHSASASPYSCSWSWATTGSPCSAAP